MGGTTTIVETYEDCLEILTSNGFNDKLNYSQILHWNSPTLIPSFINVLIENIKMFQNSLFNDILKKHRFTSTCKIISKYQKSNGKVVILKFKFDLHAKPIP